MSLGQAQEEVCNMVLFNKGKFQMILELYQ